MFYFRKIWRALFSRHLRFEIRPFALLPTNCLNSFSQFRMTYILNILYSFPKEMIFVQFFPGKLESFKNFDKQFTLKMRDLEEISCFY